MKNNRIVIYIMFAFLSGDIYAQNKFPVFEIGPIEFRFPSTMPGLMKDSMQKTKGEFTYNLEGQKFNGNEGHIQTTNEGFNGKTRKSTPWETLTELTAAQQAKDYKAIVELYTPESKVEMDKVITDANRQQFLDYVGQIKSVNVLCGFKHKNGIVAILDMGAMGLNNCYFVKVGKKYLLSYIKEAGPTIWNIALAYKFKPEPILKPILLNPFDSMEEGGTRKLNFKLNKAGNYVILFRNKIGEGVMVMAKDGAPFDSNTTEAMVDISITNSEMNPGNDITFYYAETNYPVNMVTENLLSGAATFRFRLYKKK